MSKESREAFEAAMRGLGWRNFTLHKNGSYFQSYDTNCAFIGWSARDDEIEALKARVEGLRRLVTDACEHLGEVSNAVDPAKMIPHDYLVTERILQRYEEELRHE